ncbi:MAG: bacillithiol biosynthesis cysteine-adding enzyme BshC [Bacteroidota bacterium]
MEVDCIPMGQTGFFSPLICDYLEEKPALKSFYHRIPSIANFKLQFAEKQQHFPKENRQRLVKALHQQYATTEVPAEVASNLELLSQDNTFTVTTGHQLNLFTGPLYFMYKIAATIKLVSQLKEAYPEANFIPMYWMATEDHDFEEINYFNFNGQKMQWSQEKGGAVGRLTTAGLEEVLQVFSSQLGTTLSAKNLTSLFSKAYLENDTLTEATRYLVNELFGALGLVIIDGDDALLKQGLIPYMQEDIFRNTPFHKVNESIEALSKVSKDYKIQVNPREINYFYLQDGIRERIVKDGERFSVLNTDITFTQEALEKEMENAPEHFSPNVIARPLYQEVILPNLCYIGGGGELAYWLELKSYFDSLEVPFPMLLLRPSVLFMTEKQYQKAHKLDLSVRDLFLKQNELVDKKVRSISDIDIDFSPQKEHLKAQFEHLHILAEQTDASFLGAVKAQERKQTKGLEKLEKRLLKAQKKKLKDHVVRMTDLHNALFPNGSLQERQVNFSELYLEMGDALVPTLMEQLNPITPNFLVLRY